ncbi:hypothetical protein ACO0K3_14475 [Undibacterium sp. Rencai35W]|uniref:hypothetical protein n=1 Tax=Undibacterium sp. Rencai35W TaxID=3413046 RepID=UPI003BF07AA9
MKKIRTELKEKGFGQIGEMLVADQAVVDIIRAHLEIREGILIKCENQAENRVIPGAEDYTIEIFYKGHHFSDQQLW